MLTQARFSAPDGHGADFVSTCSDYLLSLQEYRATRDSNGYLQSIATLNLRVHLPEVGIGQHDSTLQHHDTFDYRNQTTGTF